VAPAVDVGMRMSMNMSMIMEPDVDSTKAKAKSTATLETQSIAHGRPPLLRRISTKLKSFTLSGRKKKREPPPPLPAFDLAVPHSAPASTAV
jgi:hypothetical protein